MQVLYIMDARKDDELSPDELLADTLEMTNDKSPKCARYAARLVALARGNQAALDALLAQTSRKWKLARMAAVDRAILRLGLCEMRHVPDVDAAISINESVELAKRFGSEQSATFVNGILGALVSQQAQGDSPE